MEKLDGREFKGARVSCVADVSDSYRNDALLTLTCSLRRLRTNVLAIVSARVRLPDDVGMHLALNLMTAAEDLEVSALHAATTTAIGPPHLDVIITTLVTATPLALRHACVGLRKTTRPHVVAIRKIRTMHRGPLAVGMRLTRM